MKNSLVIIKKRDSSDTKYTCAHAKRDIVRKYSKMTLTRKSHTTTKCHCKPTQFAVFISIVYHLFYSFLSVCLLTTVTMCLYERHIALLCWEKNFTCHLIVKSNWLETRKKRGKMRDDKLQRVSEMEKENHASIDIVSSPFETWSWKILFFLILSLKFNPFDSKKKITKVFVEYIKSLFFSH